MAPLRCLLLGLVMISVGLLLHSCPISHNVFWDATVLALLETYLLIPAMISGGLLLVVVPYGLQIIVVPEGFSEPWKLRLLAVPIKVIQYVVMPAADRMFGRTRRILFFQRLEVNGSLSCPHRVKTVDMDFNGVKVRKFVPADGISSEAGLVFFHGGGWQSGSIDLYSEFTGWLSLETGMTVVSVRYRLAPNHVFPAAVDDCEAATRHFLSVAREHGVDPRRIAVIGDSAGGNLAAAVCLRMRDHQLLPPLKAQVLLFPALQAIDFRLPSHLNCRGSILLSVELMVSFWLEYAGAETSLTSEALQNRHMSLAVRQRYHKYLEKDGIVSHFTDVLTHSEINSVWERFQCVFTNPYFSPALAEDLSGLPRAFLATVEMDPLRDEGVIYSERLRLSGNDVIHRHYPTTPHGLVALPYFKEANEMRADVRDFLVQNL